MPYKDPEKRRASVREAVRRHRTGGCKPHGKPLPELAALRLESARDVVGVLKAELAHVQSTLAAGSAERARVVGYLCGLLLRSFETADIEERLAALEEQLRDVVQGVN